MVYSITQDCYRLLYSDNTHSNVVEHRRVYLRVNLSTLLDLLGSYYGLLCIIYRVYGSISVNLLRPVDTTRTRRLPSLESYYGLVVIIYTVYYLA
jgi:hypothetical protein